MINFIKNLFSISKTNQQILDEYLLICDIEKESVAQDFIDYLLLDIEHIKNKKNIKDGWDYYYGNKL